MKCRCPGQRPFGPAHLSQPPHIRVHSPPPSGPQYFLPDSFSRVLPGESFLPGRPFQAVALTLPLLAAVPTSEPHTRRHPGTPATLVHAHSDTGPAFLSAPSSSLLSYTQARPGSSVCPRSPVSLPLCLSSGSTSVRETCLLWDRLPPGSHLITFKVTLPSCALPEHSAAPCCPLSCPVSGDVSGAHSPPPL